VRARTDSPGLGIGLSLISTVTESVEITSPTAQENRVRMLFDLDTSRAPLA
jgi:hypothetical protein